MAQSGMESRTPRRLRAAGGGAGQVSVPHHKIKRPTAAGDLPREGHRPPCGEAIPAPPAPTAGHSRDPAAAASHCAPRAQTRQRLALLGFYLIVCQDKLIKGAGKCHSCASMSMRGRSPERNCRQLSRGIHDAILAEYGIPERDYFHIVTEHPAGQIVAQDAGLGFERTPEVVMIQIFTQAGRSPRPGSQAGPFLRRWQRNWGEPRDCRRKRLYRLRGKCSGGTGRRIGPCPVRHR